MEKDIEEKNMIFGRVIYEGFYKDGFRSEYPRMPEMIGN